MIVFAFPNRWRGHDYRKKHEARQNDTFMWYFKSSRLKVPSTSLWQQKWLPHLGSCWRLEEKMQGSLFPAGFIVPGASFNSHFCWGDSRRLLQTIAMLPAKAFVQMLPIKQSDTFFVAVHIDVLVDLNVPLMTSRTPLIRIPDIRMLSSVVPSRSACWQGGKKKLERI